MPEEDRVKTVTGIPKDRLPVVIQGFYDAGAYSVQSWEDPAGSGKFTVRAIFHPGA